MPIWRSSELLPGRPGSPNRRSSGRLSASIIDSTRAAGLPPLSGDGADEASPSSSAPGSCIQIHAARGAKQVALRGAGSCNSVSSLSSWEAVQPGNPASGGSPSMTSAPVWGSPTEHLEPARQLAQTQVFSPRQRTASSARTSGAATYTVQYIGIANGELGILSQKQKLAPTRPSGPSSVTTNSILASRVADLTRRRTRSAVSHSSAPLEAAALYPSAAATAGALPNASSAPVTTSPPGPDIRPGSSPSLVEPSSAPAAIDRPGSPSLPSAAAAQPAPRPGQAAAVAAPAAVSDQAALSEGSQPLPVAESPASSKPLHDSPQPSQPADVAAGALPAAAAEAAEAGPAGPPTEGDDRAADFSVFRGGGLNSLSGSRPGSARSLATAGRSSASVGGDSRPPSASAGVIRPSSANGSAGRIPSAGGGSRAPSLTHIVDNAHGQVKVVTECFYSRALHSRTGPHDRHARRNRPAGPQVRDMEPLNTGLTNRFGHRAPSAGGFSGWKLTAATVTSTGAPGSAAKGGAAGSRSGGAVAGAAAYGSGAGFGSGTPAPGAGRQWRQRASSAGNGR